MGFLQLLGLKQAKPKPAALVEAEKCFAPEELQAIRDAFKRALKAQGHGKSLHDEAFNVLLFGVPSGPFSQLVSDALFNVVAAYGVRKLGATDATGVEGSEDGSAAPAASGSAGAPATAAPTPGSSSSSRYKVREADIIIAKALCERSGEEAAYEFAHAVLCEMGALITGHAHKLAKSDPLSLSGTALASLSDEAGGAELKHHHHFMIRAIAHAISVILYGRSPSGSPGHHSRSPSYGGLEGDYSLTFGGYGAGAGAGKSVTSTSGSVRRHGRSRSGSDADDVPAKPDYTAPLHRGTPPASLSWTLQEKVLAGVLQVLLAPLLPRWVQIGDAEVTTSTTSASGIPTGTTTTAGTASSTSGGAQGTTSSTGGASGTTGGTNGSTSSGTSNTGTTGTTSITAPVPAGLCHSMLDHLKISKADAPAGAANDSSDAAVSSSNAVATTAATGVSAGKDSDPGTPPVTASVGGSLRAPEQQQQQQQQQQEEGSTAGTETEVNKSTSAAGSAVQTGGQGGAAAGAGIANTLGLQSSSTSGAVAAVPLMDSTAGTAGGGGAVVPGTSGTPLLPKSASGTAISPPESPSSKSPTDQQPAGSMSTQALSTLLAAAGNTAAAGAAASLNLQCVAIAKGALDTAGQESKWSPRIAGATSVVGSNTEGTGQAAGPAHHDPHVPTAPLLDQASYRRWVQVIPQIHNILTGLLSRVGHHAVAAASAAPPARQGQHSASGSPHAPWAVAAHTATLKAALPPVLRDLSPELDVSGRMPQEPLLLTSSAALLLAGCLPRDMRSVWQLVYHSERDGKSYNTLLSRLAAAPGPTLLLAREDLGHNRPRMPGETERKTPVLTSRTHVFGGFAPAPWAKSGAFFGDMSSFVFTLRPELRVFRATGINSNFQWCGQGFKELPNGIGFGGAQGAPGQFGLLLDASLESGMSRPIATYGSPCLASAQIFKLGPVEAWLLKPLEEDDNGGGQHGAGTVMDRMAQDKAFMAIAGIGSDHSAGLRQHAGRPEDE